MKLKKKQPFLVILVPRAFSSFGHVASKTSKKKRGALETRMHISSYNNRGNYFSGAIIWNWSHVSETKQNIVPYKICFTIFSYNLVKKLYLPKMYILTN